MSEIAESFWMVWNPTAGWPSYRHDSEESATAEARRLAAKNPGVEFIVLRAIAVARTLDPVQVRILLMPSDPELPF